MEPIKPVENRREDGTFGPGNIANPYGRPKGKTIKERVREWLEEHPDDMEAFVDHFVKKNKELAWQMLEGRPSQGIDLSGEVTNKAKLEDEQLERLIHRGRKDSSGENVS